MKAIIFTLLLGLTSLFSSFTNSSTNADHDFYISSTNIEYNKTNKSLEITSSYYTDDLENAIEKKYKIDLHLGTKKEHKEADKYLGLYFKENLKLTVNEVGIEYEYLGKEVEIEKTYNYIEVSNIASLNKIDIESRMLFNIARSQQNIFKVKHNGNSKSLNLFYKRQKGQIAF